MASVSSSLEVALTCYTGSFENFFFLLNCILESQETSFFHIACRKKSMINLWNLPSVMCKCIFVGHGSLSLVQNEYCYPCGYHNTVIHVPGR